ncbi:hypothetical protein PLUTO_00110 [Luteibacter phage vB_LflM-Pluto]|uniref:Cyanophage baseplate Pam3 plug gp18 domain-containing protein n=1 Tax=Luteibacter phage vB_LflM-Pluto TaxID=2948611 RepID=A0A9E7MV25_9CAUD|nr:hypothetical protein PLUTO_00110 [Luteibacter phage vB_LflM-Pluto]
MQAINLNPVPNQSIAFNVDGAYWQVHLFQSLAFVCADVTRNGVALVTGVRCFVGQPLIPYSYLSEPNFGNFVFDNEVDWRNFGTSCNLFYLEKKETEQFELLRLNGGASTV